VLLGCSGFKVWDAGVLGCSVPDSGLWRKVRVLRGIGLLVDARTSEDSRAHTPRGGGDGGGGGGGCGGGAVARARGGGGGGGARERRRHRDADGHAHHLRREGTGSGAGTAAAMEQDEAPTSQSWKCWFFGDDSWLARSTKYKEMNATDTRMRTYPSGLAARFRFGGT
jgi:hypothetical protein